MPDVIQGRQHKTKTPKFCKINQAQMIQMLKKSYNTVGTDNQLASYPKPATSPKHNNVIEVLSPSSLILN